MLYKVRYDYLWLTSLFSMLGSWSKFSIGKLIFNSGQFHFLMRYCLGCFNLRGMFSYSYMVRVLTSVAFLSSNCFSYFPHFRPSCRTPSPAKDWSSRRFLQEVLSWGLMSRTCYCREIDVFEYSSLVCLRRITDSNTSNWGSFFGGEIESFIL